MSDTTERTLYACFNGSVQGVALFDYHDVMVCANATFRSMFAVPVVDSLMWEGLMRNCHAERKGLIIADEDWGLGLSRPTKTPRCLSANV
jgi:hypothetical protein